MVQVNGKVTALVAGIGIASGVGGTRAFDALTAPTTDRIAAAPTTDRIAPITEREESVVAALGSATKALRASMDLNVAFSNQRFAARLSPDVTARAMEKGVNIPNPSDEEIHALAKRCDKALSKFMGEVDLLQLQYTLDEWSALVDGSRE